LTDRQARYTLLSKGEAWYEAERPAEAQPYVEKFEAYLLREKGIGIDKQRLAEVERIQMLLIMLEWHEGTPEWLKKTRAMEIEQGPQKINEYNERPVLPDPFGVITGPSPTREKEPPIPSSRTSPVTAKPTTAALTTEPQPGGIVHGRVKRFNQEKGYGFIQPDDGKPDIFVHKNRLAAGLSTLHQHDRVTFMVGKGMKGQEAQDVRLEKSTGGST
jgi:CspA family cold shock protein